MYIIYTEFYKINKKEKIFPREIKTFQSHKIRSHITGQLNQDFVQYPVLCRKGSHDIQVFGFNIFHYFLPKLFLSSTKNSVYTLLTATLFY